LGFKLNLAASTVLGPVRTPNGAPTPAKPQQFRVIEQKENIFLTAYAGFPVAPISMTWSFDWGSAWTRWPRALTARSTPIFLDVSLCRYLSIEAKLIASYAGAGRSICPKRLAVVFQHVVHSV
jgi:hypothetical protein